MIDVGVDEQKAYTGRIGVRCDGKVARAAVRWPGLAGRRESAGWALPYRGGFVMATGRWVPRAFRVRRPSAYRMLGGRATEGAEPRMSAPARVSW